MQHIYERARNIRVAAFDVDGVLTDGALYYADSGEELKAFDVRDGHGLRMLQDGGVAVALITSRNSRCVAEPARNLGIDLLFQGATDKLAAFRELLGRRGVEAAACAFVGDDAVDVPVLRLCGLAVAVADAPAPIRREAHYVTRARGGRGAAREVCEIILHARRTNPAERSGHVR
jgi:3-deoxy-D-manno-octulosonate 8-phosphate phosphatase (KDO 8-P phosphatase)